jgi:hypothetical protein
MEGIIAEIQMEKPEKAAKSIHGVKGSVDSLRTFGLALVVFSAPVFSVEVPAAFADASPKTLLTEPGDFDRGNLLAPEWREGRSLSGFSLLNPNRFSMRQSYSVGFASGSFGSSSSGLYLNTLSYRLADPLTLSADVGFHTPLYSSGAFSQGTRGGAGFQDPRLGSSLVLPRIGLEYKPTEHTSMSLQLFNGRDAYKAYGSLGDPFHSPFR